MHSDWIADEAESIAHGHRFLTVLHGGDLDDPVITAQLGEFLERIGFSCPVELVDQSRSHLTLRIVGPHADLVQGDLIELARHINATWRLQDSMQPNESARR
jgi:hypothetical protein